MANNFLNPLNPSNFGMNVTGNFNNLASSGTFRLPSDKVSSSGPKLSIQLSDGDGAFIHDPKIKVTQQTEYLGTLLPKPISRLVLDASDSVNAPEPNSRLRFIPPSGGTSALSTPPQNGDVAYFDDGISGLDLRFYNGTNWLSLTDAGAAPSTAAGPQYAVQFNATGVGGALGGTSDFIFDDSGVNNQLVIDAELNLSNNNNTLELDSQGFKVTTDSGIDISNSIGTDDLDISTSADLNLITNTGTIRLSSATGNIERTSGNITSTLSSTDDYLTLTNTNTSDFGVRISDKANFNNGVGASLYLGPSGSRSAILEMNVDQNLGGAPLGKFTRIYQQTPTSSATSGGYRVLYGSGSIAPTNNSPTIADLGDRTPLKYGEFYIGEGRYSGRPHINYNLASGVGFGTFDLCNSTLAISDHTETPQFVALKKTSNSDGQITVGDGNSDRVDIRGGESGINNVDVGIITVNSGNNAGGGGEFRAKSTFGSNVSSVLTTAPGANGEGRLYLYSGAAAPTSTNHTLLVSGASGGSLTMGTNSVAPTITMTGNNGESVFGGDMEVKQEISLTIAGSQQTALSLIPDDINANRSFSLSTRQVGTEYGSNIEFKGNIGSVGSEQSGIRFSPYGNNATDGFSLANLGTAGEGCSMILDANTQGGQLSGQGGGLYLGWNETTIFNNNSWPGLKSRNYNGVRPCLLVNGPSLLAEGSSSRLFSWDHTNAQEENVWVGYGTGNSGLTVDGSFTATSKAFCIDHPEPEKTLTQNLYHSCVETPTAGDNLYRYRVTTVNNKAMIKLPTYFRYLNENEMIWVSPVDSFGRAYGKLSPDRLEVHVKSDQDGDYNVLVMGTRYDKNAKAYWKGAERMKNGN
jgi:hypothetical protein